MEKVLFIHMEFYSGADTSAVVDIDTAKGTETFVKGVLYPKDLEVVHDVVQAIRKHGERWPSAKGR